MDLHPLEVKVLQVLKKLKKADTDRIAGEAGIEPVSATRASHWLENKGFVSLRQQVISQVKLSERGQNEASELPERALVKILASGPKKLSEIPVNLKVALGQAKNKNWVMVTGGLVKLSGKPDELPIERDLKKILKGESDPGKLEAFDELKERGLVEVSERTKFFVELKPGAGDIEISEKQGQLTSDIIATGSWKGMNFRSYDVKAPAPVVYPARLHPMRLLVEKIRRIFLDMGFTEARGNFVESAFWDMDVLFVPQDHPAREMQDTFYMRTPAAAKLPNDKSFINQVRKAHEEGILGSAGWGYDYSEKEAVRTLLRTHTTAVSARNLYKTDAPSKVFCIGKVFRNETLDFKHLMETYQVEGIVFDENVTFRNHLGYLKEFFTRMGFPKVRFRPSYFPYTEMSAEVEIWFEPKKAWLELGGSGIFRPELVQPLTGTDYPVLAWGLGLDRLAMLTFGLEDIRTPYKNELSWIRSVPHLDLGSQKPRGEE